MLLNAESKFLASPWGATVIMKKRAPFRSWVVINVIVSGRPVASLTLVRVVIKPLRPETGVR